LFCKNHTNLCLNQKYLAGVKIQGKPSSNPCGLSNELLYSSVNIAEAQTIVCIPSFASWIFLLATSILIEVLKSGCAAVSHIIFWLSVSAWLNIL
jgi:hypothetical protein